MEEGQEKLMEEPVYITGLEIEEVNSFNHRYSIDFTNKENNPVMCTVLLGNNNTGKTTLLRTLSMFNPVMVLHNINSLSPFLEQDKLDKEYKLKVNKERTISTLFLKEESYIKIHTTGICFKYDDFFFLKNNKHTNFISKFSIIGYGTERKQGGANFIDHDNSYSVENLMFNNSQSLINAEEWFLGTDYNFKSGHESSGKNLEQVKAALIQVLPDVVDISTNIDGKRRVYFHTKAGDKVLINQLGSGYQSLITWVVDYAKRQFDRYPESSNPLAEPGIVLVDEIDLHLHPTWQRKVINFLRNLFPKTQFIVTAHSPLVVQSADDINVVVLHRDEETEEIRIEQPELTNFQGWSVEEILRDLMDAQIYSNEYLDLTQQFEQALQEDNYPKAKEAYDQLEKIVKSTATLKMFRIQMAGLTLPAND